MYICISNMCEKLRALKKKSTQNALILLKGNNLYWIQLYFEVLFLVPFNKTVYLSL